MGEVQQSLRYLAWNSVMKNIVVKLIFLLASAQCHGDEVLAEKKFDLLGVSYKRVLTKKFYDQMPKWNPLHDGGNPPLSAKGAYALSRQHLETLTIPEKCSWQIKGITLKPATVFLTEEGKWLWEVSFECVSDEKFVYSHGWMRYLVSMGGDLVEPVRGKGVSNCLSEKRSGE